MNGGIERLCLMMKETQIIYTKSARKKIEKYDRLTKQRIRIGIEKLLNDPPEGDIKAWDPDFTKVTPSEREVLDEADAEIKRGEVFTHDDINWD